MRLHRPVCKGCCVGSAAADMFEAVTTAAQGQDIIVKAAAVADYRPGASAMRKVKRDYDALSS